MASRKGNDKVSRLSYQAVRTAKLPTAQKWLMLSTSDEITSTGELAREIHALSLCYKVASPC